MEQAGREAARAERAGLHRHAEAQGRHRLYPERRGNDKYVSQTRTQTTLGMLYCCFSARRYVPVIKADLTLEETYASVSGRVSAVPTLVFYGTKEGRDKEKSRVAEAEAALWLSDTTAAGSTLHALPYDW